MRRRGSRARTRPCKAPRPRWAQRRGAPRGGREAGRLPGRSRRVSRCAARARDASGQACAARRRPPDARPGPIRWQFPAASPPPRAPRSRLLRRGDRELGEVRQLAAKVVAQPVRQPRLELAGALARDPPEVPDLLQRHRFPVVSRRDAVLEEELVLLGSERLPERRQLLLEDPAQLLVGELLVDRGPRLRQAVSMRLPSLLLPAGHRSIDGKLVVRKPLIHRAHVLLAPIEPLGKQPRRGLEPLPEKLLLLLAQVEEELALRLRRPELHHAPVVHQVPQDVRANPPRRVGRELHAPKRVVFLHRVHQAYVSFLDQIEQVEGRAPVFVGDLHHQPQIRGHQPVRDLRVVRLLELHRQPVLLFAREQRVPRHLRHVALQRIGARQIALDGDRQLRVGGRFQLVGAGERFRVQDLGLERLRFLPLVPSLPWRASLRRLLRFARFGPGTHLYSRTVRCYTGQLFRVQAEMSDYVATTSFADLPLSEEVRKGIAERGYTTPTPVQAAVFEPIFAGRDLICRSKTGTGKTAAFGIPLLERIPAGTRRASALVLCNTRELALQVAQEIEALGKHKDLRVVAIYGGAGMGAQTDALTDGAEIIVGTPGRVYDHIRRGNLKLDATRIAVLDEADEMLSAGFYEEVTRILDRLPPDRQTLLFSATVPPDIEPLAH